MDAASTLSCFALLVLCCQAIPLARRCAQCTSPSYNILCCHLYDACCPPPAAATAITFAAITAPLGNELTETSATQLPSSQAEDNLTNENSFITNPILTEAADIETSSVASTFILTNVTLSVDKNNSINIESASTANPGKNDDNATEISTVKLDLDILTPGLDVTREPEFNSTTTSNNESPDESSNNTLDELAENNRTLETNHSVLTTTTSIQMHIDEWVFTNITHANDEAGNATKINGTTSDDEAFVNDMNQSNSSMDTAENDFSHPVTEMHSSIEHNDSLDSNETQQGPLTDLEVSDGLEASTEKDDDDDGNRMSKETLDGKNETGHVNGKQPVVTISDELPAFESTTEFFSRATEDDDGSAGFHSEETDTRNLESDQMINDFVSDHEEESQAADYAESDHEILDKPLEDSDRALDENDYNDERDIETENLEK